MLYATRIKRILLQRSHFNTNIFNTFSKLSSAKFFSLQFMRNIHLKLIRLGI